MKYLLPLILTAFVAGPAIAAEKNHAKKKEKVLASESAPLTEKEKALAAEGERLIREAEQNKNGKPIPKALLDKMNSSFPQE